MRDEQLDAGTKETKAAGTLKELMDKLPDMPIDETGSLVVQDMKGAYVIAHLLSVSGWVPDGLNTVSKVAIVALQAKRVGIDPLVAINSTAVINGKPTFYGDLPLGICQSRRGIRVDEYWSLDGERLKERPVYPKKSDYPDGLTAKCQVYAKDGTPLGDPYGFSVGDAKVAKLWDKSAPWTSYPFRMLGFRARAFALRRECADVLMGLDIFEEQVGVEPMLVEHEVKDSSLESITPSEVPGKSERRQPEKKPRRADVAALLELVDDVGYRKASGWMRDSRGETFRGRAAFTDWVETQEEAEVASIHKELVEEFGGGGEEPEHEKPASEPEVVEPEAPSEGAEPTREFEEVPISTDAKLTILALVDDGKLTRDQLGEILEKLYRVETPADLCEDTGLHLLSRVEQGLILDDLKAGRFVS